MADLDSLSWKNVSWPRSFYRAKIFQGTRTVYNWVEPTEKMPFWRHHRIFQIQKPMAKSVKRTSWEFPKNYCKDFGVWRFILKIKMRTINSCRGFFVRHFVFFLENCKKKFSNFFSNFYIFCHKNRSNA